jgi:hypothetical protein
LHCGDRLHLHDAAKGADVVTRSARLLTGFAGGEARVTLCCVRVGLKGCDLAVIEAGAAFQRYYAAIVGGIDNFAYDRV